MITDEILAQIREYAVTTDWTNTFGGKAKGSRHLFRVNLITVYISKEVNADDIKLIQAAAWLHDIGLIQGNDDKPDVIRDITLHYLKTLPISRAERIKIADCVASHEGNEMATSLEAQIVHDSDVLDKQGVLGFIRHIWKLKNLIMPDAPVETIAEEVQRHVAWRKTKLYLPISHQLADYLNENIELLYTNNSQYTNLVKRIMELADEGMISDNITQSIRAELPMRLKQRMDEQLTCAYLGKESGSK